MTPTQRVANNAGMLRGLGVLVVAVALQAAAIRAPLVHAHAEDHEADHHAAGEVHAHFGGHGTAPGDGFVPAAAADEDARYLQAFSGVPTAKVTIPALASPIFRLVVPDEQSSRQLLRVVHGHDPPHRSPGPPRAPPAFLA